MARVRYEKLIKFGPEKARLIEPIRRAIASYRTQGFRPNPRGVAYRLEGSGVITKTDANFQTVETLVKQGRTTGLFDWDDIQMDSARDLRDYATWEDEAARIRSAAANHRLDKWARQESRVEVWMEKEGLLGVLGPICETNDVPYRALTGHDSTGAKREAARRIMERTPLGRTLAWMHDRTHDGTTTPGLLLAIIETDPATFPDDAKREAHASIKARYEEELAGPNQHTVILYVGDHDPSGMDVQRDFIRWLSLFGAKGLFTVVRVAVTCDETCLTLRDGATPTIHSNPAKQSDGRFETYVETHFPEYVVEPYKVGRKKRFRVYDEDGDPIDVQSWEVEAIDPGVLAARVGEAIEANRDGYLWDEALDEEAVQEANLTRVADGWDEALGAVAS